MEENLIYKKSRQILIEQCSILDATIQQLEQELYNFDNQVYPSTKFEYFDRQKTIEFINQLKIIQSDLAPQDKNLICLYYALDKNIGKVLQVFNGLGNKVKSRKTLSVMIFKIKTKINEIYKLKYGNAYGNS